MTNALSSAAQSSEQPELETRLASPEGFAGLLKDRTKAVHREAERTGFIADLIRGRASQAGYALFLRNLVPVYAVLEAALESLRHIPLLTAFSDFSLRRLPRLIDDLQTIAGPDWAKTHRLLPEAEAYARAIDAAAAGDGSHLVAHAYARYLGDLSGGQILRPLLARTLGLKPEALGFYEFPEIVDLAIPKMAMRDALDTIAPDSEAADAIIAEAVSAFRHNIDLSQAVAKASAD